MVSAYSSALPSPLPRPNAVLNSTRLWAMVSISFVILGLAIANGNGGLIAASLFAVVGLGIAVGLTLETGIFAFFGYLIVDGAVKINSNYHPVTHVGQDLLLILLLFRSLNDSESPGFAKFTRIPCFNFMAVFLIWLFLQYLNPFGLGIVASVAGTKVYVSMVFMFLMVFFHLKKENVPSLFTWIVLLGALQAVLASWEYLYGQDFVLNLHPRYRAICADKFIGILYRPFGTTTVPGGPSVWISLSMPLTSWLMLRKEAGVKTRILCLVFLMAAVPALVFCQVRISMFFGVGAMVLVALYPGPGFASRFGKIAAVMAFVGAAAWIHGGGGVFSAEAPEVTSAAPQLDDTGLSQDQTEQLRSRLFSVGNSSTIAGARGGALDAMILLGSKTIFGIGLSRVGAASGVWKDEIAKDPIFGPQWSFADNLYRAIFTELGLPGLLAWLMMVGSIVLSMVSGVFSRDPSKDRFLVWTCSVVAIMQLISGFGNEGILYAPVSAFFWLLMGVGFKESMA